MELSPNVDDPDPLALNNLGNAEGALGHWDVAMSYYLEASKSREMESIALANFALAKFQTKVVYELASYCTCIFWSCDGDVGF